MASDLKSQLTLLKSLQDADVSLHSIEEQLLGIPLKIEEASAELNASKALIASKEAEKAVFEKNRRGDEKELEAYVEHIKDREQKLYAIKTNKEYQAALKEIADAKQANKQREDNVIQLMEKIDILGKEITQLSEGLADKENAVSEDCTAFKKAEGDLLAEKEKMIASRTEVEKKIDAKMLKQYRYVQGKFHDALAVAENGICKGCCKRIPPQVYIELQKWKELIMCPNCHRLLFHEDAVMPEVKKI